MVILSLLATHESEKLACAVLRLSAFATDPETGKSITALQKSECERE